MAIKLRPGLHVHPQPARAKCTSSLGPVTQTQIFLSWFCSCLLLPIQAHRLNTARQILKKKKKKTKQLSSFPHHQRPAIQVDWREGTRQGQEVEAEYRWPSTCAHLPSERRPTKQDHVESSRFQRATPCHPDTQYSFPFLQV